MGFALERFAEAVDPDFECKLCGQVLEEPLCTPCGHVFCASCLLPWAARRRRCPLQCQLLAPGELYRVLPLRSLIQKLRIHCDYRARGCSLSVPLRELAAHVERCDFRPGPSLQGGVSGPGDCRRGDVPAREGGGAPPGDRRGAGGGLPGGGGGSGPGPGVLAWRRREKALLAQLWVLQGEVQLTVRRYQEKFAQYMAHVRNFARDLGGGHGRVLVNLRNGEIQKAQNYALYNLYKFRYQDPREAAVDGKEKHLEFFEGEARATSQAVVLRSEENLPSDLQTIKSLSMLLRHVFPLPVGAAVCTNWKAPGQGGEHKPFIIVLERENDTLGFNIIGGRPNQNNQEKKSTEGIYVSKILENGPADRADGLEIHDKIIELNGKWAPTSDIIRWTDEAE